MYESHPLLILVSVSGPNPDADQFSFVTLANPYCSDPVPSAVQRSLFFFLLSAAVSVTQLPGTSNPRPRPPRLFGPPAYAFLLVNFGTLGREQVVLQTTPRCSLLADRQGRKRGKTMRHIDSQNHSEKKK